MSSIPLDLQRKFERRWAARFSRPNPLAGLQEHQPERQDQRLAAPAKDKRKTRRIKPAGLRSAPAT
jgi:hypothetical protein